MSSHSALIAISLIACSFVSCNIITSFADTETVTLTVEDFPEEQITLTVRKNVCTPVIRKIYSEEKTVQGYRQDTALLYGTIYPYSRTLTRKDSFAADVLQTMYCAADEDVTSSQKDNFFMRFNWQRFMEECRMYDDPWLLDKEKIMKAIASGSFKSTDIKLK